MPSMSQESFSDACQSRSSTLSTLPTPALAVWVVGSAQISRARRPMESGAG
jgi:hypothetical protein